MATLVSKQHKLTSHFDVSKNSHAIESQRQDDDIGKRKFLVGVARDPDETLLEVQNTAVKDYEMNTLGHPGHRNNILVGTSGREGVHSGGILGNARE